MSITRRLVAALVAALLGSVVLVSIGTAPAGTAARASGDAVPYGGLDDKDHPVTFIANAHHVGHFQYGTHHQAMESTTVSHGGFDDCFEHVCVIGMWHNEHMVVGAWRHRDGHHRWHTFIAHAHR